jgi:hypothetical protein
VSRRCSQSEDQQLDLEAAAEGDLIGNMLQALDDAEFRRMYRDQMADKE